MFQFSFMSRDGNWEQENLNFNFKIDVAFYVHLRN